MVKPVVAFGDPVLKAEAVEIEKNHSGLGHGCTTGISASDRKESIRT